MSKMLVQTDAPAFAAVSRDYSHYVAQVSRQTSRPVAPAGSVDTHVHVFEPTRFPYAADRAYSPVQASLDSLNRFTANFTEDGKPMRLVLVQPSPYRYDNSLLLHALNGISRENGTARGIAVVDTATTSLQLLCKLHRAGVRGIRINTEASGIKLSNDQICQRIQEGADLIRSMPGWSIQVYVHGSLWRDRFAFFANLGITIIADHFGGLQAQSTRSAYAKDDPQRALDQPGLSELLALAGEGKVYVKLSGAYRASSSTADHHADLQPLIQKLVTSCPQQLIYASDWPHTGSGKDRVGRPFDQPEQFRKVNQTALLALWREWVGSEDVWKQIMLDNPNRLYDM